MKISRIALSLVLPVIASACRAMPLEAPVPIPAYEDCVAAGGTINKDFPGHCLPAQGAAVANEKEKGQLNKLCKDLCGDGVCQQMVCLGSTCPCPETPQNCPGDCTWR